MLIDLHTHSNASDGTDTPSELLFLEPTPYWEVPLHHWKRITMPLPESMDWPRFLSDLEIWPFLL